MPHASPKYQYDCDAVLFDLDGVLVDSRHNVEHLWQVWASQHHINPDKVLHYAHGHEVVETIRLVAPHLDAEREASELLAVAVQETTGLVKIPGAYELLQSIPSDAWGIATSDTHAVASARLTSVGLPVPDVLISTDDVVVGKPDPELYLFAAMMLGVKPSNCVVIEDEPLGIQAGRSAGMHVVGVITSSYSADELHQAHVVVRKLSDIEVVQIQRASQARLIVRVKGI